MKKFASALFTLLLTVIFICAPFSLKSSAAEEQQVLSPALCVLAEEYGMAMAGLAGNSIDFEKSDFLRALNLADINSVTITSAPAVSEGELRLGNTVLTSGQTVPSSSISKMSYYPSGSSTRASFRFSVGEYGYDIPCELYILDKVNHAPTLSEVSENYLNVSTHRNMTLYGTLPSYDSDGDSTVIEIVSYPRDGLLCLTDRTSGEYTYTPNAGYSGKDSFTYVARDMYGNYSASQTVNLVISKPTTSLTFSDMQGSPSYNAALYMAEAGIMSGTQVGSEFYFNPEGSVSRGEFTVMVLHAIGKEDITSTGTTPFSDDAQIPTHMKGYINTAYSIGLIKGIPSENGLCFEASRAITRSEAAVMLSNILSLSTPTVLPVFADSEDIPTWAAPAVYSLSYAGVFNTTDGSAAPLDTLTRADAAVILNNLVNYLDK